MKIKFHNVYINNFLSIGDANVDLEDKGYCLITGINNNPNDAAKSNGSGKSSIMEAICWALTGETIRGVKDVVNMFTDGGTEVTLKFSVDNDEYIIQRYKDHKKFKTDLKIFINGQDKSGKGIRDSQKLLESYLPDLTSSLIGSVILLGQGLPQRFTNNTPAGRKEVLEKLSKSDFMIEDLKKRLSDRRSHLNGELRKAEDSILSMETKKNTLQSQIKDCEDRLNSMESPSVYEELIDRCKRRIEQIDSLLEDLKVKDADYRSKLLKLQEEKSLIVGEIKDRENQAELEYLRKRQGVSNNLSLIEMKIDQLYKEIKKAESIKDVCPTCNQKLPNVFKPDTTELKEQMASLTENQCQIRNELLLLDDSNKETKKEFQNEISFKTAELEKQLVEVNAHLQSLGKSIATQQNERKLEESSLSRSESLKASYQATVDTLNSTIVANKNAIKEIEENSVYTYEKKSDLNLRLDAINKFITIANRDFRGYLLKNVIDFIDRKSKEYCQDIFGTDLINFTLDGNNIDIRYSGKQYEVLSGGEKQKIDIIILLSIRDMLCQFLDFRCNIICVDEIFDNLDSVSCDKVLDLLSKKLNDLESVFIISHHTDLAIPQDSIITVIKQENGVSSIQ